MFKQLLSLILVFLACSSCKKNSSTSVISITFDDVSGYVQHSTLNNKQAHSGNTSIVVSNDNIYGLTWKKKMDLLPFKNHDKLSISFWARIESIESNAKMVVAVDDSSGKTVLWQDINLKSQRVKPGDWIFCSEVFSLKAVWKENNTLVIYPLNTGKGEVYFDDLSIDED